MSKKNSGWDTDIILAIATDWRLLGIKKVKKISPYNQYIQFSENLILKLTFLIDRFIISTAALNILLINSLKVSLTAVADIGSCIIHVVKWLAQTKLYYYKLAMVNTEHWAVTCSDRLSRETERPLWVSNISALDNYEFS